VAPRLNRARQDRQALANLLANVSYEVMPFKKTEDDLLAHVPKSIPITVTVTESKGLEPTLDLSGRLASHGFIPNPHLPARQIRDLVELQDIVHRLQDSGIHRVFVLAGDATPPAGPYHDAMALLRALDELGRPFTDVGVTGYPEGHAKISEARLESALVDKAPYANRVVTQICFDPHTIVSWAEQIARRGVQASVIVGMPGPVSRTKLVRISAGIGLGQSARFLQKQQNMVWRFFRPGGFNPNRLLQGLSAELPDSGANIRGVRIFTFNEIAGTEHWRRELAATLPEADRTL